MKKLILLLLFTATIFAQNPTKNAGGFYAGTTTMNASAIGQFDSTAKGFLFPRMTTIQRDLIATPSTSLLIFNVTDNVYQYYNGATWLNVAGLTLDELEGIIDANAPSASNPFATIADIPDTPTLQEVTDAGSVASVNSDEEVFEVGYYFGDDTSGLNINYNNASLISRNLNEQVSVLASVFDGSIASYTDLDNSNILRLRIKKPIVSEANVSIKAPSVIGEYNLSFDAIPKTSSFTTYNVNDVAFVCYWSWVGNCYCAVGGIPFVVICCK